MKSKSFGKTLTDDTKENKRNWKEVCKQFGKHKSVSSVKVPVDDLLSGESQKCNTKVKVFHEKIIKTLEECLNCGFHPLLVNCINGNFPLQSLKYGVAGQEFDVFRLTNVYDTIDEHMYPVHNKEIVYSPEVLLLKSSSGRILPKPMKFSMASLTIVRNPSLVSEIKDGIPVNGYKYDSDRVTMQEKIRAVFGLAIDKNIDCVIFSDFGCDMIGNPYHIIVDLFNQALDEFCLNYVFFSVHTKSEIRYDETFKYFHTHVKRYDEIDLDDELDEDIEL
jgi:hypothetical protein